MITFIASVAVSCIWIAALYLLYQLDKAQQKNWACTQEIKDLKQQLHRERSEPKLVDVKVKTRVIREFNVTSEELETIGDGLTDIQTAVRALADDLRRLANQLNETIKASDDSESKDG